MEEFLQNKNISIGNLCNSKLVRLELFPQLRYERVGKSINFNALSLVESQNKCDNLGKLDNSSFSRFGHSDRSNFSKNIKSFKINEVNSEQSKYFKLDKFSILSSFNNISSQIATKSP